MIATMAELERVRRDCRKLVTRRALASAAAAVVPVPGVEAVADMGLLYRLLPTINKKFQLSEAEVEALEPDARKMTLKIATGLGNALIGRVATERAIMALLKRVGVRIAAASAAKYVPVVGTAAAGVLSFGAMRWIGNAHIEDCYQAARALIERRAALPA